VAEIEIEISSEKESEGSETEMEYGPYDAEEIECAAKYLMEAEAVKKDKEKMKYVAQYMREKADKMTETINSLDDLKKIAKKKMAE
jgi:hypothetical protein